MPPLLPLLCVLEYTPGHRSWSSGGFAEEVCSLPTVLHLHFAHEMIRWKLDTCLTVYLSGFVFLALNFVLLRRFS